MTQPIAPRKAAILLASLDPAAAEALLAQMPAEQADAVRAAVVELGDVDSAEQQAVIEQFVRTGPLLPTPTCAGIELDKPDCLPFRPSSLREDAFDGDFTGERDDHSLTCLLDGASIETLAAYLQEEHPQTIAVIVSQLESSRAAELLSTLPSRLQGEVTLRLVHLDETDGTTLREIKQGIETWLAEQSKSLRRRRAGLETLKSILAEADGPAKQKILHNLAQHDHRLATKLSVAPRRRLDFTDLGRLPDSVLVALLHRAPSEVVRLALAEAEPALVQRVLGLLSMEDARMLRHELNHLGPTRLSDVQRAQQELARLATTLESTRDEAKHLSVEV